MFGTAILAIPMSPSEEINGDASRHVVRSNYRLIWVLIKQGKGTLTLAFHLNALLLTMDASNNKVGKSDVRRDSPADGLLCSIADCNVILPGGTASSWLSRLLAGSDASFLVFPTVANQKATRSITTKPGSNASFFVTSDKSHLCTMMPDGNVALITGQ